MTFSKLLSDLSVVRADVLIERDPAERRSIACATCPVCNDKMFLSYSDTAYEDANDGQRIFGEFARMIREWLHDHACIALKLDVTNDAELEKAFLLAERKAEKAAARVDDLEKEKRRRAAKVWRPA